MTKKQYQSLLIIFLGFIALGYFFDQVWFYYVGVGVGLVSILIPKLGKLILKGWEYLALGLGWVNSRILLTLVFYLILTPVALLSRIFNKDKLNLKQKDRKTMWVTRNHAFKPKDLENPF